MELLIVVPPGFETLAATELDEKFPELVSAAESNRRGEFVRGGLSVSVPTELVPDLHFKLKLPTSIRERLYEFKCRDFPKLFNKIQSLPWRRHLIGDAFELSVSAETSRLGNEKRIAETVTDGIRRYFSKQPAKKPAKAYTHSIYVRMSHDICTISRDLSGEPLFQRGYKELSAVAPMRENLAAGLFYGLWRECGGFDCLVDPMCGSGTFLFESWLFWRDVRGLGRDFAFLHDERWALSRQPSQQNDVAGDTPPKPAHFFGFDRDSRALKSVESTAASLIKKRQLEAGDSPWSFTVGDVLSADFSKQFADLRIDPTQSMALIVNPPYGERIALPMPPQRYYPLLLERLTQPTGLNVKALGVVIPSSYLRHVHNKSGSFSLTRTIDFKNGGLDVQFQIFQR